MDKKEKSVLRILEDFKDTLENELIGQQTQNRRIKIKDVKLVGQISSKENIFMVEKQIIENTEDGNKRVTVQKNYYLDDRCIGGTIGNNNLVFGQDFQNAEQEKAKLVQQLIETTSEEEIEKNSFNNLRRKEIAEILTAQLGRKVTEEEVQKKLDEMDEKEIEELKEEKKEFDGKDESDLSKKQTDRIKVNGIQKADLNKLVDGKETLGKRLDLEEYDSLYVVYSDKVKDVQAESKVNNTTYSLVGMKKNGEAKVLNDEFEIDRTVGYNPSEEQTKIKADGIATKDNKDLSVYTRKTNGVSIGCENNRGSIDMFMYQKTLEENENVGIQIETSQTPVIPIELREIMNRNKGMYQKDKIQDEVEGHIEEGCDPDCVQDFDGIESTATHEHLSDEGINEYVLDIYNYENSSGEEMIKEVFTEKEVRAKLLKEIKENIEKLSIEQIVQNVKEEMNRDAEMLEREHKM